MPLKVPMPVAAAVVVATVEGAAGAVPVVMMPAAEMAEVVEIPVRMPVVGPAALKMPKAVTVVMPIIQVEELILEQPDPVPQQVKAAVAAIPPGGVQRQVAVVVVVSMV